MRGRLVALGGLALACAASAPAPQPAVHPVAAARAAAAPVEFPPTGPVALEPGGGPAEGTLYQLLVDYDGRTEVATDNPNAGEEGEVLDEKTSLEVQYRSQPMRVPGSSDVASSLVLEALHRRTRLQPPGAEQRLEIADDRLRVSKNDKVETDLKGAQPKENLTPRTLLGKSFAVVDDDAHGNPRGITIRGLPAAKKLMGALPLREALGYLQMAYPDHPVAAGDVWHAKRYLANPIGKLGLPVDLELRLIAFERNGDAPCAHAVVHAKVDTKDVPSDIGFRFESVRYDISGDVWYELGSGDVIEARLEDVAAVEYHRTATATPARVRMRYEGHSSLRRLDALPPSEHWADGTKRFSAVK